VGQYVVAFQANTGNLWIGGSQGWTDTKLGMMANTSPSITVLPNGQNIVAFQANTSDLWIGGSQGWTDTKLGMMANTSPSITVLPNGQYVVAFQANTSALWIGGSQGWTDTKLGMMANTSPSIAALPNGQYVGAFQANTGNLWIGGSQGWTEGLGGFASFGAHDLQFIQIAENADGRLELFALGGDSSIYHIWMTAVNNGWMTQWSNFTVAVQIFEVALDEKGRLVVAYLSADGRINLLVQSAPNGGWTTPHPSWFSDPEPKPIVTLTANPKGIKEGQSTTLSWTSSWADALSIDQGIGSVTVPSGSLKVSPQETTDYTITATGRGGTASDSQLIEVEVSPPPIGWSKVALYNCNSDMRTVYIWVNDLTAQTGWQQVAPPLPSQYDGDGPCGPGTGAQPKVISLANQHEYQIVAVDPEDIECDGQNDPTIGSCARWGTSAIGLSNGPVQTFTIS
jgi:hypothetical protein